MKYSEATDIIYGKVYAVAKGYKDVLGYIPQVIFANNGPQTPPDGSKVWLRVGRTTAHEGQAAFATDCGAPGQQLFDTDGLLWVQFFLPMADPKSDQFGQAIVEPMRDAFRRNSDSGIWFRNSRIVEVAPENQTIRYNVVAEFHHTSIY